MKGQGFLLAFAGVRGEVLFYNQGLWMEILLKRCVRVSNSNWKWRFGIDKKQL